MNYFSTFSGIGGFEIGIQRAFGNGHQTGERDSVLRGSDTDTDNSDGDRGWERAACVGYSEIDRHSIKTYEEHYDHADYGDITKITAESLPDFDLIVGGFPCQSFSIAGKRGGFDDTRGTLFFDIARILAEKRPGHLVLENVKGLLSHDSGKTFSTILGVLADLGYSVEWQVLNSKNFGVPQNRERVYIVGHLAGECTRQVFPINDFAVGCENPAVTLTARGYGSQRNGTYVDINPEKPVVRVPEPTKKGYTEATTGDSIYISHVTSKTRRGRVGKGVANTLDTGSKQATLDGSKLRRLTPVECERLQGFPDNWTEYGREPYTDDHGLLQYRKTPMSDTQRYKQTGNAVTTNVVETVITRMIGTGCFNE